MLKFLDPTGCTYRNGQPFVYNLPRRGERYAVTEHPEPAPPDGCACGPGRLHLMKVVSAEYALTNWWPWHAPRRWQGQLIGEDIRKAAFASVALARIEPRVWWRYLRRFGTGAYLRGAVLTGANLYNARLTGADLRGADLRGADLRGADLSRADLRGADLSRAVLRGADLRDAVLSGAVLTGADLSRAVLREADLRDADLRNANLRGADLRRAIQVGAIGLPAEVSHG